VFQERFLFKDRQDAGAKLASRLVEAGLERPVVLGIPRGGVPIGIIVASALSAPFSLFVCRKIGAPGNPEYGIGAVAEDGTHLLDSASVEQVGASARHLEDSLRRVQEQCAEYVRKYRGGEPLPHVEGKTVVLCDDGLATGITMLAAVAAVKKMNPTAVVVAAPVASLQAVRTLQNAGAVTVACCVPENFGAVAQFYARFDQLSDTDIARFLRGGVLFKS